MYLMISNSIYGDIAANFFHELTPETLNVQHHFFVDFDLIYDVYYDRNVVHDIQAEKFLKTIERNGEQIMPPKSDEAESLEICRAALQSIQSGAYQISVNRKNEGDYALNKSSATVYTALGSNWVSITHVPDDDSYHGYMFVENDYYSNEGNGWDSDGSVHWTPDPYPDQVYVPWIADFQWNEELVSYTDTILENGIKTIMLRIDEPFPGYEDLTECYFVNVKFIEDGSFLNAEIFMDFIWENDISSFEIVEAIITLDEDTVHGYIYDENTRAVSES